MVSFPYNWKKRADKSLTQWDRSMNHFDIDYFLVGGTCLGFVREGNYIKGDNDFDFSLIYKDSKQMKDIKLKLASCGIFCWRQFNIEDAIKLYHINYMKEAKLVSKEYNNPIHSCHYLINNFFRL